jgi:hypothetical protein
VHDHALREERVEGLDRLLGQVAGAVHRPREEARVEQVQDRVLDAADILVDVHPVGGGLGSVGVAARGAVKRAKYHDESTKVSIVSVSRRAAPPQAGQVVRAQVGWRSSGLPGRSKLTSSGRRTGRFSFFSGTTPQAGQCTTGIGQPQ